MPKALAIGRLLRGHCSPADACTRATRRDVNHRRLRYEPLEQRQLLSVGVSGKVWNDLNGDGVRSAGEPGIAGAVVEIYSSNDTTVGGVDDIARGVTITWSDGSYGVSGLPNGLNYYEIVRPPVGYAFTAQDVGSDDTVDSDVGSTGITVPSFISAGQTVTARDAGLVGAAPSFGFAFRAGAANSDNGQEVRTDAAGNVYATGVFRNTVDFDPGPGTYNLSSIGSSGSVFVAKYSPAGALVWARSFGCSGYASSGGIAVGSDGCVYTTGNFAGTGDFDPGPGVCNLSASTGSCDIFVSKLDAFGNFVWARDMDGTSNSEGSAIAVASDNSVYTTGYFQGTVDFDPGSGVRNVTTVAGTDIFISKLDSSGNLVVVVVA